MSAKRDRHAHVPSSADAKTLYGTCQQWETVYGTHVEALRQAVDSASTAIESVHAAGAAVRRELAAAYAALVIAHGVYADTKRVDQKLWQLYYRALGILRGTVASDSASHAAICRSHLQVLACIVHAACQAHICFKPRFDRSVMYRLWSLKDNTPSAN
jgi:hypothetical protein